jgi:hypothetical protein
VARSAAHADRQHAVADIAPPHHDPRRPSQRRLSRWLSYSRRSRRAAAPDATDPAVPTRFLALASPRFTKVYPTSLGLVRNAD